MKRIAWTFVAMLSVCGCGGEDQSAAVNAPPAAPVVQAPSVATPTPPATVAEKPTPVNAAKKPDYEPPGLVLPEHEPDAIGAKGLELPPIR